MGLTLSDGSTPDSILPRAAKFAVFSAFKNSTEEKEMIKQDDEIGLAELFCVNGVCVTFEKVKIHVRLSDRFLSLSLEYIYKKTSQELIHFNDKKFVQKIGTICDGIPA